MGVDLTPLRWPAAWPAAWKVPGSLSPVEATPAHYILTDAAPPAGIAIVRGPWPGIRLSQAGGDNAVAGPTGEPWVDSNGWRIRAARVLHPDARFWVDSKPQPSRSSAEDYVIAIADAAAHGGRWVIQLDDRLAEGIAAKKPEDLEIWKTIVRAAEFFNRPPNGFNDEAVIGVLSSFATSSIGFTDEVLNNLARTKQQYRALASISFAGLKGIIYTDSAEPSGKLRKDVLDFVNAGGMLITGPAWGSLPKGPAAGSHPRFAIRSFGKGSIALATAPFNEPYRVANDAVAVVSHRNDIVRYFNSGPITPCLASTPDKRRALLQTVFYSLRPVEDISIWVKGAYRSARLRSWNQPELQNAKLEIRDSGVEVFLPPVAQYASLELEA